MAARSFIAQQLYESNCAAHGWRNRYGDPLPKWQSLSEKQQEMWLAAADRSTIGSNQVPQPAPRGWE